jgi:hypothetical protein
LSDVVVSVVESVTAVTVSEQEIEVAVTESPVTIVTGTSGPQGAVGATGPKGDTGATGPQGLKGDKGDQGEQGPQGIQGETGATGATGAQGSSGVVSVTAPITNTGTSTAANIGIDQSGLTLAQSQITNLLTDLGAKANLANPTFTGIVRFATLANTVSGKTTLVSNFDNTGAMGFLSFAAANKVLTVRGFAGQTGNLTEWQGSDGSLFSRIDSGGNFRWSTWTASILGAGSGNLVAITSNSTVTPIVARGAASQSANLQQWQNSAGTSLASVTAAGEIYSSNALRSPVLYTGSYLFIASEENSGGKLRMRKTTAQVSSPGANLGAIYFRDGTTAGTLKFAVRAGASGVEESLFDNIDQSGTGSVALGSTVSVAQAQVANLLTDLGSKANLADGNSFTGTQVISTGGAANRGLVVKPFTGQSALPIEVRNAADTGMLFSVDSSGNTRTGAVINTTTFNNSRIQMLSTGTVIDTQVATNKPLIVKGAASQSANLQEWQNSAGTVLARVTAAGVVNALSLQTANVYATLNEENAGGRLYLGKLSSAATNPGAGFAKMYFRDGTNAGTLKLVVRAGAAGAETTILDNIPQ